MTWSEVRRRFPDRSVLVEATEARSEEGLRLLDQIAVLESFDDGGEAMKRYCALHRQSPHRELYVLHTQSEDLEIEEIPWLGVRGIA